MEHYTKNTVEASAYCKKCQKHTPHQVWDGRIGSCLQCLAKLQREHDEKKPEEVPGPQQEKLF